MTDRDPALAVLWRPYCWIRGYHDPHHCDAWFETCNTCELVVWTQRDEDERPAWLHADRLATTWRRLLGGGP